MYGLGVVGERAGTLFGVILWALLVNRNSHNPVSLKIKNYSMKLYGELSHVCHISGGALMWKSQSYELEKSR